MEKKNGDKNWGRPEKNIAAVLRQLRMKAASAIDQVTAPSAISKRRKRVLLHYIPVNREKPGIIESLKQFELGKGYFGVQSNCFLIF